MGKNPSYFMRNHLSLLLLTSLSLAGCSLSGGNSTVFSDSGLVPGTSGGGEATLDSVITYDQFWDVSKATSFEFRFSNASLHALSDYGADYDEKYADVYFPASLKIVHDGVAVSYSEVGVRMKGNNSRTEICDASGNITDVCHFKVSFKATFDDSMYDLSQFKQFKHDWTTDATGRKERKSRRFAGMEKLDLKYLPRNNDLTYAQEIYSFHVFQQNGIVTPNAKWATATVASASSSKTSAYEAIEAMDDVFLSHHFAGDDSGDLYKCNTFSGSSQGTYIKADLDPSGAVSASADASTGYRNGARLAKGKIGVEDNYSLYHPNYQLKTNDNGENSDFSKMANLINGVYNLRYKKAPYSLLTSLLDVDEFLKMEAVSYCLGNFDDQRNNYNNYFIYFRASDGKAVYIPYDWDWSLGAAMMIDCTSWKPYHTRTSHDDSSTNSLYWCTILTSSTLSYSQNSLRSAYATAVKKVVSDGYLDYSTYTSYVNGVNGATKGEYNAVSSYMSSKKSIINGAW
jgi:spore coat protein CotH